MLTYFTSGESHGKCLVAVVDGLPYGTPFDLAAVNAELERRQGGYGRGARMRIEKDEAEAVSGVRHGRTIGSPITLTIANRVQNSEELGEITRPRPGHADLAGAMKFGEKDARNVSERSSARETAARVAAGALARAFLSNFDVHVLGYVVEVGGVGSDARLDDPRDVLARRAASPFYAIDPALDEKLRAKVDEARAAGDTVGGRFEVVAFGTPPGLGSHASWESKLDGRLARALMSVQTVKGVEIGLGFEAARRFGSQVHDAVVKAEDGRVTRASNNAGGIEGGISNGLPIVARAACKPISTLRKPLGTVDLKSGEPADAAYERSDVCVVPAASVIGEAVVAFEIAAAFLDKFGADTFDEVRTRFDDYRNNAGRV